jgi:hypothetical protein
MILVSELRKYVKEKEELLPAVNSSFVVVEKGELSSYLTNLGKDQNQIMVAVMPDARSKGGDEDNISMNNSLGFLFLEKTDYSVAKQDKWLDIFERTQLTAVEFMRMIVDDIFKGKCDFSQFLDTKTMSIEPESGLSGCNGWSVEFFFDVPL